MRMSDHVRLDLLVRMWSLAARLRIFAQFFIEEIVLRIL